MCHTNMYSACSPGCILADSRETNTKCPIVVFCAVYLTNPSPHLISHSRSFQPWQVGGQNWWNVLNNTKSNYSHLRWTVRHHSGSPLPWSGPLPTRMCSAKRSPPPPKQQHQKLRTCLYVVVDPGGGGGSNSQCFSRVWPNCLR